MKKLIALAFVAFLAGGVASAQHGHGNCGNCPHHAQHAQKPQAPQPQVNADGIDMAVMKAFPTVKSLEKKGKWTEVYDAQHKMLGYVVYSKPASDTIRGFNGETPVVIAFNTKKVITGVYALPNMETPKFAKVVQDAGFYNNWNGLTVKQARKKKVDTVSGATYTSRAVALSVQAALEKL